jgi:hypothetical protein
MVNGFSLPFSLNISALNILGVWTVLCTYFIIQGSSLSAVSRPGLDGQETGLRLQAWYRGCALNRLSGVFLFSVGTVHLFAIISSHCQKYFDFMSTWWNHSGLVLSALLNPNTTKRPAYWIPRHNLIWLNDRIMRNFRFVIVDSSVWKWRSGDECFGFQSFAAV